MMNRKILIIGGVVVLICVIGGIFVWQKAPKQPTQLPAQPTQELKLSDFPEKFKEKTVIVLGDNATEIERQAAEEIKNFLLEQGLSDIKIIDLQEIENFKKGYNLVIIGTPKTNPFLEEVYALTNATRVTEAFPGEGKGVLEILRNPWDESKAMLLVEGSDEWGVKVGSMMLEESQKFKDKVRAFVDWKGYTGIDFPIDSPEEAIEYAKTDIDVKKFIEKWSSQGYNVKAHAKFSDENNHWFVQFHVVAPVEEIWFSLEIDPNGIIIHKGGAI